MRSIKCPNGEECTFVGTLNEVQKHVVELGHYCGHLVQDTGYGGAGYPTFTGMVADNRPLAYRVKSYRIKWMPWILVHRRADYTLLIHGCCTMSAEGVIRIYFKMAVDSDLEGVLVRLTLSEPGNSRIRISRTLKVHRSGRPSYHDVDNIRLMPNEYRSWSKLEGPGPGPDVLFKWEAVVILF